ncbi:MAG: ribbon-helix-helix protein, CopG family [Anaerolineae bacterium]|nr:ribbon-helix-helix protein, CopG family [Anaerolineae bacterium]
MKRTLVELPEQQWQRLNQLSRQRDMSMAELIRRAIDQVYPPRHRTRFGRALDAITGMWHDREDLGSTESYVRKLRQDDRWERWLPNT